MKNISTIEFDIVEACNLRCEYCYLQLGDKNRLSKLNYLTKENFDLFFSKYTESIKDRIDELNISFWGGEPLLKFDIIKYIVDAFNTNPIFGRINYTIVSNGTLITDEIVEFCVDNNIMIQITIDGNKDSHDSQRIYKNGKGSFDSIKQSIALLKKQSAPYYLRSTLTSLTPLPSEIIKNFRTLKIAPENDSGKSGIGFGMITPITEYDKTYLAILDSEKIANDIMSNYLQDSFPNKESYHSNIGRVLKSFFASTPRKTCGVHSSKIAVKFDGEIYPCHRMVSNPDYAIGSINSGINNQYEQLYETVIERNLTCKKCSHKYICGGSCFHEILLYGDQYISKTTCDFNKSMTKVVYKYLVDLFHNEYDSFSRIAKEYNSTISISDISSASSDIIELDNEIFVKSSNAQCIDLDIEGVMFDSENFGNKYIANSTMMCLWELIDGKNSVEKISEVLSQICEVDCKSIKNDIVDSINSLYNIGLIKKAHN